jgi:hypothetical protein
LNSPFDRFQPEQPNGRAIPARHGIEVRPLIKNSSACRAESRQAVK